MATLTKQEAALEYYHRSGYLRRIEREYGLSADEYLAMLEAQDGRCAICRGEPHTQNGRQARLSVDHDHVTGKPRGLVCHNCNRAIGLLGDDPARALALADYLWSHQ